MIVLCRRETRVYQHCTHTTEVRGAVLYHFIVIEADGHSQSLLICFLCCLTNVFSPVSFVIFWLHLEPLRLQPLLLIWAPKSFSVFLFFHIPDLEWTRFLRPNALQFALCVYILPSRCRLAIYSFVLMSSVHLNKPLWVFFSFLFFFVIHTPFSYVSKLSLNNESRITKEDLVLQLSAMTLSAKLTKTTFKCWKVRFCIHFLSLFFSPESVLLSQSFLSLLYLFLWVLDISIKVNCNELVSHNLASSLRVDQ